MDILQVLYLFFFLIPFSFGTCPISKCGNNGSIIRFPFRLQNQQSQNCSYPGFDLRCTGQRTTTLKLPYFGDLYVRDIDYITQQMQLYDPDNCLPRRLLLDFNLSGSPFKASYSQNYTFLSCPSQLVKSRFTVVDCLSNSTTSVLATSSLNLARSMSSSCKIIETLTIPVSWPVQFEEGFSSDLSSDLQLTWDVPDCRNCETNGGICGFKSNTSQELGCFDVNEAGSKSSSKNGLHVFRIIAMSITIPAMLCTLGIAFFVCFMDTDTRNRRTRQPSTQNSISPQPISTTIITTGLAESTIESYTKLVLGESCRLPGPNNSTCPICLSDYCTKETLRCIPECKHCFHAECIDEWLRINITCPVCRNSPSPAHVNEYPL